LLPSFSIVDFQGGNYTNKDEIDPVILPPVTLPPVIFPVIDVLSPVGVCAAVGLMTVNPVIDRVATPPRMANIANIAIVVIGKYASSGVYKVTNNC
jgi:hypothetical protein